MTVAVARIARWRVRREALRSPRLLASGWLSSRLVGVLLLTGTLPYGNAFSRINGDVRLYGEWSDSLFHGLIPYHSFPIQYPPGILPLLALPHSSADMYVAEFVGLALLADLACLVLLSRAGHRLGAWLWLAAVPLVGPVAWGRLDIFVALALVVALLSFESKRFAVAGAALAYAGLLKLWPLALILLLVPLVAPSSRRRYLIAAGATVFAFVGPLFALAGLHDLLLPITFEMHRGVEIESVVASPLHAAQALGARSSLDLRYGSLDLEMTGAHVVALVSSGVLALCWVGVAVRVLRDPAWRTSASGLTLAIACLTICFSKVLSPQYLLWVCAAAAVLLDRSRDPARLAVWTCFAGFTTQLVFPFLFLPLAAGTAVGALAAALHAGVLAGLAIVAIREHGAWQRNSTPEWSKDELHAQTLAIPLRGIG